MALLELRGLVAGYGAITALKGIDLTVDKGEIVALIGSNGAGKSTTLRTISGLIKPKAGSITFKEEALDRMAAHEVVRKGVSHVPEGRGIFHKLSVLENLQLGAFQRNDDQVGSDLERVFTIFPRLKDRSGQRGGTLSGGEQQMLAIGRALMSRPELLLLDEPSMGLAPLLVETIFTTIREIREEGTTILLVEQNAAKALALADRAYVLESGLISFEGTGAELATDERVRKAYLGEE